MRESVFFSEIFFSTLLSNSVCVDSRLDKVMKPVWGRIRSIVGRRGRIRSISSRDLPQALGIEDDDHYDGHDGATSFEA